MKLILDRLLDADAFNVRVVFEDNGFEADVNRTGFVGDFFI
mgnify:CR=1 FL=1